MINPVTSNGEAGPATAQNRTAAPAAQKASPPQDRVELSSKAQKFADLDQDGGTR